MSERADGTAAQPAAAQPAAAQPAGAQPARSASPTGRRLSQLDRIPVDALRTVGERRARGLEAMGIVSVLDLLVHYPRRYEDWTTCRPLGELAEGDQVTVVASVASLSRRRARSGRSLVEVNLVDGSGRLRCTFFNQPWRAGQLQEGQLVVAAGRVSAYRDQLQMANPSLQVAPGDEEDLAAGRVVAVYPESERAGMGSAALGRLVEEALARAGPFADPLPDRYRRRVGLVGRTEAFRDVHRPASIEAASRARRRLAFDELWRLQLALVMRKQAAARAAAGIRHDVAGGGPYGDLVGRFLTGLPFPLTGAQRRVLSEIAADLSGTVPMHRLLQGDVGAGKTVVALATLLYAVQGGHQGVLLVPTEVLAEQHLDAARRLLAGLDLPDPTRLGGRRPVGVELLTSRTTAGERARLRDDEGRLTPDVLVGTHALLTEEVAFRSLGVVVIDEQHRFGVDQRARLREQAGASGVPGSGVPDLLVMTATPIPRTAAMTVYGDLDASVLDELPPGRAPVATRWVRDAVDEAAAWTAVREEVAAGRRAFVVCPLVGPDGEREDADAPGEAGAEGTGKPEETGTDEAVGAAISGRPASAALRPARSAVVEAARLADGELASCRVGLLHGQLPARDKQAVMAALRAGQLDVLVATTVIEVGVDVPEATVMVVLDADRFGLAQLHQLRGRVGRAGLPARCFLVADEPSEEAIRRLEALEASNDGFELAEVDLELRGEGTVLGARQKGRSDLKLASLARHRDLVQAAREVAEAVLADDPALAGHPLLVDELLAVLGEEEAAYLFRS